MKDPLRKALEEKQLKVDFGEFVRLYLCGAVIATIAMLFIVAVWFAFSRPSLFAAAPYVAGCVISAISVVAVIDNAAWHYIFTSKHYSIHSLL